MSAFTYLEYGTNKVAQRVVITCTFWDNWARTIAYIVTTTIVYVCFFVTQLA